MPKANYSLSTQRLNIGSPTRGSLSPMQVNSGAGRIKANQINPNAAHMTYSPTKVPNVVLSNVGDEASLFVSSWANSAINYAEREDQTRASELVMKTQNELNVLLNGGELQGAEVAGYSSRLSKTAVEDYGRFSSEASAIVERALGGASESVKAKALLKIQAHQNNILNKGSQHKAQQNLAWEAETQQAFETQIYRDVSDGDVEEVQAGINSLFAEYDVKFHGRPEYVTLKKQEAIDRIGENVVTRSLALGDFSKAYGWLDYFGGTIPEVDGQAPTGEAGTVQYDNSYEGAYPAPISDVVAVPSELAAREDTPGSSYEQIEMHPTKAAKLFAKIEAAEAAELKAYQTREAAAADAANDVASKQAFETLATAVKMKNYGSPTEQASAIAVLESIPDIDLRSTMVTKYNKLTSGRDIDARGAKEEASANLDGFVSGSEDIYSEYWNSVLSVTTQNTIAKQVDDLRKANVKNVGELTTQTVNSLINDSMESLKPIPAVKATDTRMRDQVTSYLTQRATYHLTESGATTGEEAMAFATNDLLTSGLMKTFNSELRVSATTMPRVSWMSEISDLEQLVPDAKGGELSNEDVRQASVKSARKVYDRYQIPMDIVRQGSKAITNYLTEQGQSVSAFHADMVTLQNQMAVLDNMSNYSSGGDSGDNTTPSAGASFEE